MAGSYNHVDPIDGSWSMIENMGDAYECVEELLWLVLTFARLATLNKRRGGTPTIEETHDAINAVLDHVYYPMANSKIPKDEIYERVQKIMEGR